MWRLLASGLWHCVVWSVLSCRNMTLCILVGIYWHFRGASYLSLLIMAAVFSFLEDEGSRFIQNVSKFLPAYMALSKKTVIFMCNDVCLISMFFAEKCSCFSLSTWLWWRAWWTDFVAVWSMHTCTRRCLSTLWWQAQRTCSRWKTALLYP